MRIVAGVDGSEQGRDAVALATRLADAFHAELVVAHVSEPRLATPGSVAAGLHEIVEREHADVLVLGSSRRGPLGRVLLGGVAERTIHGLPCALAVAPDGYADHDRGALRRIGVAYDASPEASAALHWAELLAVRAGANVALYRVVEFPHMAFEDDSFEIAEMALLDDLGRCQKQELEDALQAVPDTISSHSRLLEGPVAVTLADATEGDDLLVMGARGHGAIGTIVLGSVSRALLHRAGCPVVVIPRGAAQPAADTQAFEASRST